MAARKASSGRETESRRSGADTKKKARSRGERAAPAAASPVERRTVKRSTRERAASNRASLSLESVLARLEEAGTAQNRKIYARHGAEEPMFGTSFAELKKLTAKIGIDHDLACGLWWSGNSDARTLAIKIADPGRMSATDLDRWVKSVRYSLLVDGVAQLAAESPHARAKLGKWLAKSDDQEGLAGWSLVSQVALRDETFEDVWFEERLEEIETGIHSASNLRRAAMNLALISIGGRNASLRERALAAAKRIGRVEVDHGETSCKTPDAAKYIAKLWDHAASKGFETPAAQERARKSVRVRC